MFIILLIDVVVLGVLLALSAFFSATEMALFSLNKLQVRRLRQSHPRHGQIIGEMLDQPHRLLATILLGNTIVNISAAVLGYRLLELRWATAGAAVAVPVMTVLILVTGEVVPKTLVIRHPEFYALLLARPTEWMVALTTNLRHAAESISARLVQRIERWPYFSARAARPTGLTAAEYRTLLIVSERAGVLHKEERDMVNKVFALENMLVKEIMTPRVDMQCLEDCLDRPAMVVALRQIKHRRVPLIHDSPDTVVGILNVKEFLIDPQRQLPPVIDSPHIVPDSMSVAKLLKNFRKEEHPVAIVVDEYGGTQGMVTLEDILEEIVGEIEDEFDTSEVMVQRLEARRFLINGKARLQLVNDQCGVHLEAADAETLAGWMIGRLGSLPREGEQIRGSGVRVTARKVARNRVREVLLEVEES